MEKIDSNGSDPLDSVILRFAENAASHYVKCRNSNGDPVGNGNFTSGSQPKREALASGAEFCESPIGSIAEVFFFNSTARHLSWPPSSIYEAGRFGSS